jgi:pimeloyl-ACP methyl ester carboxylesterase
MAGLVAAVGGDYLDQYFDSGGVQIHYVERGAGEPVVLVSGSGNSVKAWIDSGVFELPYHVIAVDCLRENQEAAEDVVRLLDHLHTPKAHIVGYSRGGHIVAKLLRVHPDRVMTATLGGNRRPEDWSGIPIPTLALSAASDKPNAQFAAALAQFLRARPFTRRVWAPRE